MNSSNNTGCRPLLAPDRVIVKFAEGVLPTTPPRPVEQRREADDTLSKVLDSVLGSGTGQGGGGSAGLSVRRYLEGEQEAWQALVCRAQAYNPGFRAPRFQDYVEVSLPAERCAEDVVSALFAGAQARRRCKTPRGAAGLRRSAHAPGLRGPPRRRMGSAPRRQGLPRHFARRRWHSTDRARDARCGLRRPARRRLATR